jgi:hypothetical protein
MEVRDSNGNLLGSGERFRVQAAQGRELLLHVFGAEDPSPQPLSPEGRGETNTTLSPEGRGAGAYTLVIDVLPQMVSVNAEALLPGVGGRPGGPTTSLVLTFQGDRLDPATAEDPGNYTVTFVGADDKAGTADDRTIPVSSLVYNPGANVEVSSGRTYPTAVRQTVTLVFDQPLPAGSYVVQLSPQIQTAPFNEGEADLLANPAHFAGHPVVTPVDGQIVEGARVQAVDLVLKQGALGDLAVFTSGTAFLTQLHGDLGARLDALLTQLGDDPSITDAIRAEILQRIVPSLGEPGQRPTSMMVIFLDPVSIGLVAPNRARLDYDLGTNALSNQVAKTFVEVGGNVVVVVAGAAGSYRLDIADVPQNARGVAVLLGPERDAVVPLTAAIREGQRSFTLSIGAAQPRSPSPTPSPDLSGPAALAGATGASPVQAVTNVAVAPSPPALPPSSGNAGAAQESVAPTSDTGSTGSLLGDSTGGGGTALREEQEGGGRADGRGQESGNPPDAEPFMQELLKLLHDLWEMLRSLLAIPPLSRP